MSLFDLIGSFISADAQRGAIKDATNAQNRATATAIGYQQQGADQANKAIAPFLTTGTSALSKLAGLYGLADGGTYENGQLVGGVNNGYTGSPTSGEDAYLAANPDVATYYAQHPSLKDDPRFPTEAAFADYQYQTSGKGEGRASPQSYVTPPATGTTTGATGATGAATGASADPFATFYQSPDYQFRLGQGINGVDAGAAARGALDSGATRKAEIAYAGNLASGEYQNYKNGLMQLAGVGQTASGQTANVATGTANNVSNLTTAQGNNQASSYLANGQVTSNLVGAGVGFANGVASAVTGNPFSFLTTPIAGGGGGDISLSDLRLKEDVHTLHHDAKGRRWVSFRYVGQPESHTGVIAQEVAQTDPWAVHELPSGYLAVDYGMLH